MIHVAGRYLEKGEQGPQCQDDAKYIRRFALHDWRSEGETEDASLVKAVSTFDLKVFVVRCTSADVR